MSRRSMQKTPKIHVAFAADRNVLSIPNQGEALVAAGVLLLLNGLIKIAVESE